MFVNWEGSMWEGYLCTAVITDEAQIAAFNYVLSQSEDYEEERSFSFDKLPALEHLGPDEYREEVCRMVADIVETARKDRRESNGQVLGVEGICAQDTRASCPVPVPKWFEDRKRMIVWTQAFEFSEPTAVITP